jgi:N-glycosylase/DNA lyase
MLRVDEDLSEFWRLCRAVPRLRWVARRRAGRLLRAPTLFEDLLKLLFTTNCAWSATRRMTDNLVGALGPATPSGHRAFPSPAACAAEPERFWRDVVRAGYRARACRSLARLFEDGAAARGELEDPAIPTDELRRRLRALPGFGPYAAGQALRLLGRYDDLALDSWCRTKLGRLQGRARPPADRAIERAYRPFGRFAGLALWMDLTADWHRARGRTPSW